MSLAFSAARRLGPFSYEATLEANEEIVVLFGHSGAGKSVTLQMIAGLLRPDSGRIVIDGVPVFDSSSRTDLPPQQRNVGYVVQDLGLFPHLTVAENIAFGIPQGRDRATRVAELIDLFKLGGMELRKPPTLSGGQQQRVALARALAHDTDLLLLDEPFSALDESLRASLRRELLRLRRELGLTIVFVTHDLREAHLLADRMMVFDEGRILQGGSRDEIFRRPISRRVGELTGVENIWEAQVISDDGERVRLHVNGMVFTSGSRADDTRFTEGETVDVLVRAGRINLRRDHVQVVPDRNLLTASIVEEFAYGSSHSLRLKPNGPGPELEVELPARPYEVLGVASRKLWTIEVPEDDIHVVPAAS